VHCPLDYGSVPMRFTLGHLPLCLSEVYEQWAAQFDGKGVTLRWQPGPDLMPFCFDWDKVQQVVSNLLANSLQVHAAVARCG